MSESLINLTELPLKDTLQLSNYLDNIIFPRLIQNLSLGPNNIFIDYLSKTCNNNIENKYLEYLFSFISGNFDHKQNQNQNIFLLSSSNIATKAFFQHLLKKHKNEFYSVKEILEYISIFTCFIDSKGNENPICDYIINLSYDENLFMFCNIEFYQENFNFIFRRKDDFTNLNIFSMMFYNLPISELKQYFICDITKDYFKVFDDINNEEFILRYKFLNQFKITRTKNFLDIESISSKNKEEIKKEFEFYKDMYSNFRKVRKDLKMSELFNENYIFSIFAGIMLLGELESLEENIVKKVIEKVKSKNTTNDIFVIMQNILLSDLTFSNKKLEKNEAQSLLNKISNLFSIQDENLVLLLISDLNSEKLCYNKQSFSKMKEYIIKNIYKLFFGSMKNFLNKESTLKNNLNQISFVISRSNLVYHQVNFKNYSITTHKQENLFVADKYVKETMLSNYIQELKYLIITKNALKISSFHHKEQVKINSNEEYIDKIINEETQYNEIVNLFEDNSIGLLKLIEDNDFVKKIKSNANDFLKKNLIDLIDSRYLKIRHSFGPVLYDLNELQKQGLTIKNSDFHFNFLQKIMNIKIKPNYLDFHKFSKKIQSQRIYIHMIIKPGTYPAKVLVDDMNILKIQNFYHKFYNFIIEIKDFKLLIASSKFHNFLKDYPDDYSLFRHLILKKIKITSQDYYYDNGILFINSSFNKIFSQFKFLGNFIFKYDQKTFNERIYQLIEAKNFSYFRFLTKAVIVFNNLIKVYREKKTFRLIKSILLEAIMENYQRAEDIDKEEELKMDFQAKNLPKFLPKFLSYLKQFKFLWKNYLYDIFYLQDNKEKFKNYQNTIKIIKDRMENFKAILYLFGKKYQFININLLRKIGILHHEFIKKVVSEIDENIKKISLEMKDFVEEHMINFEEGSFTFESVFIKSSTQSKLLADNKNFEKIRRNSLKKNEENPDNIKEIVQEFVFSFGPKQIQTNQVQTKISNFNDNKFEFTEKNDFIVNNSEAEFLTDKNDKLSKQPNEMNLRKFMNFNTRKFLKTEDVDIPSSNIYSKKNSIRDIRKNSYHKRSQSGQTQVENEFRFDPKEITFHNENFSLRASLEKSKNESFNNKINDSDKIKDEKLKSEKVDSGKEIFQRINSDGLEKEVEFDKKSDLLNFEVNNDKLNFDKLDRINEDIILMNSLKEQCGKIFESIEKILEINVETYSFRGVNNGEEKESA